MLCPTCLRPRDQDDAGASWGNGYLCMDCGFYRAKGPDQKPPVQKKTKTSAIHKKPVAPPKSLD